MLLILSRSCFWVLRANMNCISSRSSHKLGSVPPSSHLLTQLAIVQLLLTVMALTSYHVQIINRISSAYPLWYWYLVWQVLGASEDAHKIKYNMQFSATVQIMVIYALVQATLFGSFLPPA